VEAVDEKSHRAKRRHPTAEHRESIGEATALESDSAQYQLANAQQGKNQALTRTRAGG